MVVLMKSKAARLATALLFSTLVTAASQKAVESFSPASGVANIGTTITFVGTSLSTADEIAVVDATVTLAATNTSAAQTVSGCASLNTAGTQPAFSGNLHTVNPSGTEGVITVYLTTAKTYSVCTRLWPTNSWTSAAAAASSDLFIVAEATISSATMVSNDGGTIRALMNQEFELVVSGQGLIVDATAISIKWHRGRSSCSNGTAVSGGDTRRLDTANNAGTSGTVAFTLTDAPQSAMSLCFSVDGGPIQAVPATSASLQAPEISAWTASPVAASTASSFTVETNVQVTLQLSGNNLLGEATQAACDDAELDYSVCIKVATTCLDPSDVSDIAGGDSVAPAMNSVGLLTATFSFAVPAIDVTGVVCSRSQGTPGVWTQATASTIFVPFPPVAVSLSIRPVAAASNFPLSLTITGRNFVAAGGASETKVKLTADCTLNTLSDSVGAVSGGSGRTCASLTDAGSGKQLCVAYFEALSSLSVEQLQVCIQSGPGTPYALGGTQIASVTGGGGSGYTADGYVFDAAGTSCLGSSLALNLGLDDFGSITSIAIANAGEGYTCPPRFRGLAGTGAAVTTTLTTLALSAVEVLAVQVPATVESNAVLSVSLLGKDLGYIGSGGIKVKADLTCSAGDTSSVLGGDARPLDVVGTDGLHAEVFFELSSTTQLTVVLCWTLNSLTFTDVTQFGSAVSLQPLAVTDLSPLIVRSQAASTLTLTGAGFSTTSSTPLQVKISSNCSLEVSDAADPAIAGSAAQTISATSATSATVSVTFATMRTLQNLQLCWRSTAFPYTALPLNLTVLSTTASSFTPSAVRAYLPFVLIITGNNLGPDVYVKLALDCGSSTSDSEGTVPGSEGRLPTTSSTTANTYNYMLVALTTMDLHVCYRVGPGNYARVGTGTVAVTPIRATNFIPKTGVSNTALSVTVTGSGFIASPANLLVRLKLSEDCALHTDSHESTCGNFSGDCKAGGEGTPLGNIADGGLSGVWQFNVAALATHPLDLCWSLDTTPPLYSSIGLGKLTMPPPTALAVSLTPTGPSVHQTITVLITGTGLVDSGLMPAKVKLARECVGYDDVELTHDIPGGEAQLVSCSINGDTSASAAFRLRSSKDPFRVCFAPGRPGITGQWTEVPDASGQVLFAIRPPRVSSASLSASAPVANVPFRVILRGVGFGSTGEQVKVKVVPEGTGCGFPYTAIGPARSCACNAMGMPSQAGCRCQESISDFEGVVVGGAATLVEPVSTSEGSVSLTLSDVGGVQLCWSVGAVGVTGPSYTPSLSFLVAEPTATCVEPARTSRDLLSTFHFRGEGISAGDTIKFVSAEGDCTAAAVAGGEDQTLGSSTTRVSPHGLSAIVEATITTTTATSLTACYRYLRSKRGFKPVGRVRISIAEPVFYSYSPLVIWTDETFTASVSGAGLATGQRIKLIRAEQECTNIFATDAQGGAEQTVACTSLATGEVLCEAQFTISQLAAAGLNNLTLCYSYTQGLFVEVGAVELRLPSVSGVAPSQALAGAGTTVTVTGEGFRSTLAKALKFVAMHAECGGTSAVADAVAGGQALALPVAADASSLLLPLSFLPASAGPARVCFQAGSQNFRQVALIDVVSPVASSAAPLLYGLPTPRSAVPAAVPFQLSVQGIGLAAPGILVKIIPATSVCEGSIHAMADAVEGGGGQALTNGLASFSGLPEVGSVKACMIGAGWASFAEIPGSGFEVQEATAASIVPQILILDQATRLVVSGEGLTPALLSRISLRKDDCVVGRVPPGGEEAVLIEDDNGFGRRAYADFTVSSATTLSGSLRVCLSNSVSPTRFRIGSIEIATVAVRTSVYPSAVQAGAPSVLVLVGQGLDTSNKLKVVGSALPCAGVVGDASENTDAVAGGEAQALAAVSASHTEARSAPISLDAAGSYRICFASGAGSAFTDLIFTAATATPSQALLSVRQYAPRVDSPTLLAGRMQLVRGAQVTFTLYGTGVQANDVVVVTRDACPTDATAPSSNVVGSITAVSGSATQIIRGQSATVTTCGNFGFTVSMTIEEVGSGLRMCYVPAGFSAAVPLNRETIDVVLPSTRSLSPTVTYANRQQTYTLRGSGGYRPGDKVKLIRAYSDSTYAVAPACSGLSDVSDAPGGDAYVVTAADIAGSTLSVPFKTTVAYFVARLCYLPEGAGSYQDVGTEEIEVRPPQVRSVELQSISARSLALVPVTGLGLSTNDRFKVIAAGEVCGEANDALSAVDGGSGRQATVATNNGGRVEVPFTVATTAIGPAQLCFKHEFSCEYKLAAPLAVNAPAITALGNARQDGNTLNRVYPNRDAIMRLNGIGLELTDIVRVVAPTSPCNSGVNFSLFGQASFFEVDPDRGSGLVTFNLLADQTQGRVCYRYCDTQCRANTPFEDTSIVLPLVQPTLTRVTPKSILTEERTTITITGTSITDQDRVKIVFADQPCAGTDESAGILTGGNGRPVVPLQDCNTVRDRGLCTATVAFSLTFPGEAKLCYWYHGGPGYQEVAPGVVRVCRGECVAATASNTIPTSASSSTSASASASASQTSIAAPSAQPARIPALLCLVAAVLPLTGLRLRG